MQGGRNAVNLNAANLGWMHAAGQARQVKRAGHGVAAFAGAVCGQRSVRGISAACQWFHSYAKTLSGRSGTAAACFEISDSATHTEPLNNCFFPAGKSAGPR